MDKFSKISKSEKPGEWKPVEYKLEEIDVLKSKIYQLMDSYLTVTTYGPVDRYQRAGSIKIAGKDVFLEALLNLIEEVTTKDGIKMLQEMKNESNDWKLLDEKIQKMEGYLQIINESNIITNINRIREIRKKSIGTDEFYERVKTGIPKIKNPKTALVRHLASLRLIKSNPNESGVLEGVSKLYLERYEELSNNE
jgi:hypothetical protein